MGESKVKLMAGRVKLINPEIKVQAVKEFYTSENGGRLVAPDLDYVVDAIDNISNKLDLLYRCVENNIPVVSGMGAGNKLDPTAFKVADISETSVCPLARVVRRKLKKLGILRGVQVVYSTEPPVKPESSQVVGSISFVPSVAGLILASVVIKSIILKI